MQSFGERLRISWKPADKDRSLTITAEGFPAGEKIDTAALQAFVRRRSPGRSPWTASRREPETLVFVSGLRDDTLDGSRLEICLKEEAQPYPSHLQGIPRPGHADLCVYEKYGIDADLGEQGLYGSESMTLLCAVGGIALQILDRKGICVGAHVASVGLIRDHRIDPMQIQSETLLELRRKSFPVLEDRLGMQMIQRILREKAAGNSIGGQVEGCVVGLPKGLGGAWFDGLEGKISQGLYAVPAVKGVEFGSGFGVGALTGSQNNDHIVAEDGKAVLITNFTGGILGGLSTGLPLIVRAVFKPTPSIALEQNSVDLNDGSSVVLLGQVEEEYPRGRHERAFEEIPALQEDRKGRHEKEEEPEEEPEKEAVTDDYVDLRTGETVRVAELGQGLEPCVVPRAVPMVESVLALVILDSLLINREAQTLEELRSELAGVDRDLLRSFEERMNTVEKIARYKAEHQLPTLDSAQEERVYARVRDSLPEEYREYGAALYRTLLKLSKSYQSGKRGESGEA